MAFQFNDDAPIQFQDDLPEAVDVVIVGAGVIGISTAWFLREKGLSVLVCDKGRVAGEQSSRNWGWVRTMWRDPAEVPIAKDSIALWEQFNAELGQGIGFKRGGILGLTENEEHLADWEAWMPNARDNDLDARLLTASEAAAMVNGAVGDWKGGMVTPSDARAEPFTAVPTLAKALQQRGGLVREACAVRTVETSGGKISGVVTEHGAVKAQAVVCAAGAWSNMFMGNLGIDVPQLTIRATVARTEPVDSVWDGAVAVGDFYLRRRNDGGYTATSEWMEHPLGANSFRYYKAFGPCRKNSGDVKLNFQGDPTQAGIFRKTWSGDQESPFERCRVLDPEPSDKVLGEIRRLMKLHMPALADVSFTQAWGGMIDATPDLVPVMDGVPGQDGLYVATGFSGHGFGIGPGAGRVMSRIITGEDPGYDLMRFRFNRFSDGSPIDPGPAI